MTSYATRTQNSSEQNDLKKLKSKYSSKLNTLKELFADWSDEDLLFALDEADGVLEVAVDRISEGHATQWGEVKTKKAKKEAQQKAKAAAAATTPSSAQTMSYQKPERTYTERPKPTKARVPSTHNNNTSNNYSRKSTTPAASSWGYNSGQKSSTSSSAMDNAGGSWASIASTKPAHDTSSEWNTATTTTTTITDTTITNDGWTTEDKEITETTTSSALLDDSDKPKSWASLLKSQPKPEPPVQTQEPEWTSNEEHNTTTATDEVEDAWNTKDDEIVKDEWNAPVETPTDAWGSTTAAAVESEETKVVSEPVQDVESNKPTNESPAAAPTNDIDVKFGSLNLADETPQEPAHTEESLTDTKVEAQPQPQPPAATEPTIEQTAPVDNFQQSNTQQQQQQQPSYLKQQEPTFSQPQINQQTQQAPAQPVQPQIQQQTQPQQQTQQLPQQFPHQQPQQQQQQQPFGMDHLTSAYSSYLPNQHPTGMSGFGMSPMGNLPDYGVYGTEAQRAAAMGYYDPSAFNNSPGAVNANAYPSRDKFGQDTSASLGAPQGQSTPGQSQGLHNQQMYPGMPYYPYYYMPNHYNAYQQSMYGQPMMGKNMYPNMYQQQQQQATPVSKSSTQSPYGANGAAAAASPYALHSQLYGQQPTSGVSGYDDLQQQFGLHDYQKSPYGNAGAGVAGGSQQLHGFLGHQLQGQQGSQQQGQQGQQQGGQQQPSGASGAASSQQGQVVDPSIKNDAGRGNLTSSSQPQQHQHQQQQHQMNNYFGQQQMFSYQQYPQHQYWNQ